MKKIFCQKIEICQNENCRQIDELCNENDHREHLIIK